MTTIPETPRFIQTRLGEAVIPQVNRATFDKTGSDAVFHRHFGERFRRPDTFYLIVGTDSGLLPRWIRKQEPPPGSRYLFLEPEGLVEAIRERYADLFDDDRQLLTTLERWEEIAKDAQLDDYVYLGNIEVVSSLGAKDAYLDDYLQMTLVLESRVEELKRDMALQKGSHIFLRRQIENIPDNLLPASVLRRRFEGRTAVLLGGGPSLDQILPWVIAHRPRLTVLAVSRIARQLSHHGVRPDFLFHIDPHPVSFDVSKECLLFPPDGPVLICGNHAYAGIQAQFPGPVLYCGHRFPRKTEAEPDNLPTAGPTVTNLALATAIGMGFSQVILGGVDLCYDRLGNTHAEGSDEHQTGPALAATGHRVTTNGGWMADTDAFFALAVTTLGRQAQLARSAGCRVINPAPGAARIPDVEHRTLEEITLPAVAADTPDIASLLADYTPAYRIHALRQGLTELRELRRALREIERLCLEARRWNQRIYRNDGGHDLRFKKRMDKIENRLDRRYPETTRMVKQLGLADFLRLIRPGKASDDWTPAQLRAWGDEYYRVYAENAAALIRLVDQVRAKSESRLAELAEEPDLERLLDDWQTMETPGRARRFLAERPGIEAGLTPVQRARFDTLTRAFEAQIQQCDTAHRRAVQQRHDLAPVRARLQLLFHRRNTEELDDLIEALAPLQSPLARELHSLAAGYRAELAGMTDQALIHYQEVVDATCAQAGDGEAMQPNPRLEDALQRIAALSLEAGDGNTALAALDALSALSPFYEPHYAELLRLHGRYREAAEAYTDYLTRAPHDLDTMLKLGALYQEAGAGGSARWVFEQILQQEPQNQAARTRLAELSGAAQRP